MKTNWKPLALCLAIPLAIGGISSLITKGGMETFKALRKPPLSPPGWLFPIVWTLLFFLMGLASYKVLVSGRSQKNIRTALLVYGVQLFINFLWPIFFFNLGWYLFAFAWLVFLWVLIWATQGLFFSISKPAGWMLVPYLAWVAFAGYLNMGIYLLN